MLGLYARGHERDAERNRSVHDAYGMLATVQGGEAALESGYFIPVQFAPFPAAERLEDPPLLRLAEHRPAGEWLRSGLGPAKKG